MGQDPDFGYCDYDIAFVGEFLNEYSFKYTVLGSILNEPNCLVEPRLPVM